VAVFDRLTLREDLVDCRGAVLAPRGAVVSPQTIAEAARSATPSPRCRLEDSALAADLAAPFEDPAFAPLFARDGARGPVERTLRAVALPEPLLDELAAERREEPGLYRHALLTAAVALRVFLAAVGQARALADLAAAALLHDLGMRRLPGPVLEGRKQLTAEQVHRLSTHPLLGAYQLALLLGHHPAVDAAQGHHWRCGQGYPRLSSAPSRSIEVIAVASAFCAMTQPRPYRSGTYDARGAADVLVREAAAGHADVNTVKLLVHALRGGGGDPRAVRFGGQRDGHGPRDNHHGPVVPAAAPGVEGFGRR
jgi:hypothetical protein